jgi:hypothetical protein
MGRIDNFWMKSLPRLNHLNLAENNEINAENVFLSCDGVIFGGTGNIQGHKRSYEYRDFHEQLGTEEMTAITRGKNKSLQVSVFFNHNFEIKPSLNFYK